MENKTDNDILYFTGISDRLGSVILYVNMDILYNLYTKGGVSSLCLYLKKIAKEDNILDLIVLKQANFGVASSDVDVS